MPRTKERRLHEYLLKCQKEGYTPTFGDICEACSTTVKELLGKTIPNLRQIHDFETQQFFLGRAPMPEHIDTGWPIVPVPERLSCQI